MPLIKNVLKPLAKRLLIPLELAATAGFEKNAVKQKGGFLGMLLNTLGDSLLANLLTGKGIIRTVEGAIISG